MFKSLQERLFEYFQPEELVKTFCEYEEAKRDFFTGDVEICMGADGISYETFKKEKELSLRCAFISRRVLNGTYQFYPFRETNVTKNPTLPQSKENERVLSISTIRDVIVQKNLYKTVYDDVEKLFNVTPELNRVSCAYRKGKSAPYAALLIHQYIKQGFVFVLDANIVKFFDKIPHDRLLILIEKLFGKSEQVSKLLVRFVKTGGIQYRDNQGNPYKKCFFHYKKPCRPEMNRKEGIPQGGVLSGMLANLYLHEFDRWIVEELSRKYKLRYVRYADDFVILLKEEADIINIHKKISQRIDGMGLKLHDCPKKTKHLHLEEECLEFVGFEFTLDKIKVRQKNIETFKEKILKKIKQEPTYWPEVIKLEHRLELFIRKVLNRKILGRGDEICPTCSGVIGERTKSWMGFFSAITDTTQLHELDKWIRREVSAHFYREYGIRLQRADFGKKDKTIEKAPTKEEGLASLEQEYYRIRKKNVKLCSCETSKSISDASSLSDSIELGNKNESE